MFMIFGNHAINLDLVTCMSEDASGVIFHFGSNVPAIVAGVTIDQILTAQAAGQSRVQLSAVAAVETAVAAHTLTAQYDRAARAAFDDGSKRGQSTGNDKQAMNSIGRK